jgi:type IV secretion system protein TrbG
MQIVIKLIISFGAAVVAFAQQPSPPAIEVKRQPAASDQSVRKVLRQYDFGEQLRALQSGESPTLSNSGEFAAEPKGALGQGPEASGVPKDYRPRVDVPLNATAMEAVRVSEKWRGEANAPAAGNDGRVLYSFGAGLPTVVCAPLRVCMIELQPGEKIVGEPQIGDSVRWNIAPALYGTGDQSTAVIVLKPQTPGLDTNLLVTTDRRAYYLRLISKAEEYVARVAFAYPDDDNRKWKRTDGRAEGSGSAGKAGSGSYAGCHRGGEDELRLHDQGRQ